MGSVFWAFRELVGGTDGQAQQVVTLAIYPLSLLCRFLEYAHLKFTSTSTWVKRAVPTSCVLHSQEGAHAALLALICSRVKRTVKASLPEHDGCPQGSPLSRRPLPLDVVNTLRGGGVRWQSSQPDTVNRCALAVT